MNEQYFYEKQQVSGKLLRRIMLICIGVVFMFIIFIGLYLTELHDEYRQSIIIKARITDIEESIPSDNDAIGGSFIVTYSYNYKKHRYHAKQEMDNLNGRSTGDIWEIRILPDRPDRIVNIHGTGWAALLEIIAIIWEVTTIMSFIRNRRRRQERQT